MFILLYVCIVYWVVVSAQWKIRRVHFSFHPTRRLGSIRVMIGQCTSFAGTEPSEWEIRFETEVIHFCPLLAMHPLYHRVCTIENSVIID